MWKLLSVIAGTAGMLACLAQAEPNKVPHGTVELVSAVSSIEPGSSFQVGLLFRLEPGWHIYWKNPGDSGQPPRLNWQLAPGLTAGEIEWPAPKRLPVGPLLDYGYDGDVLLPVSVQASPALPVNGVQDLRTNLRVLVCRETCIPGKASLILKLPVRKGRPLPVAVNAPLFSGANQAKPRELPAQWRVSARESASELVLTLAGAPRTAKISFIPAHPNQIENAAPQKLTVAADGLELALKRPGEPASGEKRRLEGLLSVQEGGEQAAYEVSAELVPGPVSARGRGGPPQNLLVILALAFGGGLILNLMPCVFPVLSVKVLSLLEHSGSERRTIRVSAGVYTFGVLVSFWALVAVLLVLRSAGRSLGWGFQLQSPGFVAFLICLLFVLGLNLMGVFEIGGSVMSVGSELTQRGKYSSSFFTGVLATVVATPCTAPFMGVAVGFALGQPASVCALVFTVMAIGLACPFLLLSVFPQFSGRLPKPGAWMETLKQLMAFPLFATVIWLLWVIGQQVGINQLAILLMGLLILSITAWLAGRWPQSRTAKTVAVLLGTGVVVFCSATLAPDQGAVRAGTLPAGNQSGNALKWEPFTPETLARYQAAGRPVLIDFTAAWCLTCQVNDRVVFHSAEVQQRLSRSDLALLRADWTSYNPTITEWLAKFGRSGVPFYVIYSAQPNAPPITLPDGILTPSTFLQYLSKVNL